jgi:lysyl-tRNA synthetase class 2
VTTPVRIPAPALEDYIEAEPSGAAFLRTSPELHMKRLLAAGAPRIYQLGPCFRRGELGPRHLPEFTMLEWYRAGADYLDILADTCALLRTVALSVLGTTSLEVGGRTVRLDGEWDVVSVQQAFESFAGTSPEAALAAGEFERLLVDRIEPRLGLQVPSVLIDYPVAQSALARRRTDPDGRCVAERWELYIAGVELANAYSELTDAAEQEARFRECAALREREGRAVYPLDRAFLEALRQGMPAAGGAALGFDRLCMLVAGAASLSEVTVFGAETCS